MVRGAWEAADHVDRVSGLDEEDLGTIQLGLSYMY